MEALPPKADAEIPRTAGPSARWSVGPSLAVPACLVVFILFFLPWHQVFGGLEGIEPVPLLAVRGMDRATGSDLAARAAEAPIGFQELAGDQRKVLTCRSLGFAVRLDTPVGEARPLLWLVPMLAAEAFGLGLLQVLSGTRRVMSLAMTVGAAAMAGLLAWEAGWLPLWTADAPGAAPMTTGVGFVVTSEPTMPLLLSVWTAVFAALAGLVALVFPGRPAAADHATPSDSENAAAQAIL